MPAQQDEKLNVPYIVKLGLDIFNERYIAYYPDEKEIWAKFDRTQLIRVVTNLVKNAIQATENVEEPKIYVVVKTLGDNVLISVQDNGVGITEENRPRIFEPKFTTKNSGMGLGLGMVKSIVETYGGNISFESAAGDGTTFTVVFPRILAV